MKTSKYITLLQNLIKEEGDLDVVTYLNGRIIYAQPPRIVAVGYKTSRSRNKTTIHAHDENAHDVKTVIKI